MLFIDFISFYKKKDIEVLGAHKKERRKKVFLSHSGAQKRIFVDQIYGELISKLHLTDEDIFFDAKMKYGDDGV
jgi:hypothetical protein